METKVVGGIIILGVFGFVGFLVKEWTGWTSSTLIDLNSRTAVMESEIKHHKLPNSRSRELVMPKIDKSKMKCNKPKRQVSGGKKFVSQSRSYMSCTK